MVRLVLQDKRSVWLKNIASIYPALIWSCLHFWPWWNPHIPTSSSLRPQWARDPNRFL